jgi:hypothetical protein
MDDNKVAVLLEDLRAQFRTFGEGLQLLNDKVDRVEQKLDAHIGENRRDFGANRQEHQLLMQMVKELDTEVVKMKRVK